MNEWKLQRALENKDDGLTDKAIRARLSRARRAERLLCEDLDHIVMDDDRMYAALIALKNCSSERSGGLQNALRWYYRAVNGSEFPRLSDFCPARRVGTAPLSQNSVPAQAKHLSPIAGSHMPLVPQMVRKAHEAGTKILLCFGGQKEFLPFLEKPGRLLNLEAYMVRLVADNDFDGLDIDWEITLDKELHAGMICELHALSPRADQDALIRVHLLQHLTGKPDHHMVDAAVLAAHIAFLSGCRTIDDAGLVADAGKALQGGIVLVYAVLDGDAGLDVIADDAHAWIEQAVVVYDAAH